MGIYVAKSIFHIRVEVFAIYNNMASRNLNSTNHRNHTEFFNVLFIKCI